MFLNILLELCNVWYNHGYFCFLDDAVYLEDDQKKEEYVLNEQGKVYVGAYSRARGRPWAYGQFDDVVLPVAAYILELSRVADSERGNPVRVVRGVSAGVSCYL